MIGVAVLTLSTCDKEEEIPVESHSYDDYISKYDTNLIRTGKLINHEEAFIMEGKRIKFAEEKTIKLKKVLRAEKIERARLVEEKRKIELEKQREKEEIKKNTKVKDSNDGESNNNSYYTSTFNVSFYTAHVASTGKSKGHPNYGKTASGTYVKEGRTVACPKNLPFGTKVDIEGLGVRYCEDRGGAIVSGHLDVYVNSESTAPKLGRKYLKVKVYN